MQHLSDADWSKASTMALLLRPEMGGAVQTNLLFSPSPWTQLCNAHPNNSRIKKLTKAKDEA